MIRIELRGGRTAYSCGDKITGLVRWSDLPSSAERLEIRLIWYTKGKGDRDVSIEAQRAVATSQPNAEEKFEFIAPNGPYSFSGKLISLIWAIEVVVFPGRDAEMVDIVIAPEQREVLLLAGEDNS